MEEKKIKLLNTNLNYIRYYDLANKYTILIVHGWGGSSNSWLKTAEILFNYGYNVIVPDLPGFGKTKIDKVYNLDNYAEILEKLIINLDIKNLILWGHSNGGAIAIKIVNRGILNITRLILNNSAGIRNDTKRSLKRKILNNFSSVIKKLFKIFRIDVFQSSLLKKSRTLFYRLIGGQDYLKSQENPFLKQTYLNIISSDLTQEISKININTLLIWGEKDTYTPISDGKKMRKLIPNSKIIILENMKHGIHLSNPELLVNTFLNNI